MVVADEPLINATLAEQCLATLALDRAFDDEVADRAPERVVYLVAIDSLDQPLFRNTELILGKLVFDLLVQLLQHGQHVLNLLEDWGFHFKLLLKLSLDPGLYTL